MASIVLLAKRLLEEVEVDEAAAEVDLTKGGGRTVFCDADIVGISGVVAGSET